MRLDEYLEAIEACPDEWVEFEFFGKRVRQHRLTAEFGIYNNWTAYLKTEYSKFLAFLIKSNRLECAKGMEGGTISTLVNEPATAILYVLDFLPENLSGVLYGPAAEEHRARIQRDYNTGIILLAGKGFVKTSGIDWQRSIQVVISNIGRHAIAENIPLCFPESVGWLHPYDFSRIVFHPASAVSQRERP